MAEEQKDEIQELYDTTNGVIRLLEKEYNENSHRFEIDHLKMLYECSYLAMFQFKDINYALKTSWKLKWFINKALSTTRYKDIWGLEGHFEDKNKQVDIVKLYYDVLKLESYHLFESFMFYLEKNRKQGKRFYLPRKKTLHTVVQDLQDLENRKIKFLGVSLPARVGKALAWNTPILTNHGWKYHGELTLMDRVLGIDGDFHDIQAIHNPCRMEYKVTFSDGEEIICHGNHEWTVNVRGKSGIQVIETKEMFKDYIQSDGHHKYNVPFKEYVSGSHLPLWVDPYTLGAWLGDGRNQNPDICGAESDYAIVQKILDAGYELAWDTRHKTTGVRYYGFKGLREQLQKYGMCHSRRRVEKHIPDDYLIADEEQRLELLAGLLDTDGTLRKGEHRYSFTTNEEWLRDDFISLVNTFGWQTCVVRHEKGMISSGIYANKPYWAISFNPDRYIPCQLERKQLHEYSKQRHIVIEKIEPIKDYVYGNCITVEGGVYLAGRTLKPTHNSTICIFFLAWVMMKRPNSHSAMGGHSGLLAKGFYKELLNLVNTEEYTFKEMYEYWHAGETCVENKSAEEYTINLGLPDRFSTFTARGADGTWTGAVDISKDGYLYIDDLVRDREHSLSPQRMENTFQEYLNKMVDRKNDGARELMVGTLWNVLDPLERIRKLNEDNPEFRFRKIPALNENDESNFDYDFGMGFSTEYYKEMRNRLDNAEWQAKYQQQPFVREGILFEPDQLRYFNGILPDGDSRTVAVVDVAYGGGDNLSMPIGVEYENGDVYIIDWIFSKGAKEETIPLVAGAIIRNEIRQITFEGNQGGDLYCDYVNQQLLAENYKCACNSKKAPNTMAKIEKIMAYSGDIKRKFVFIQPQAINVKQNDKDASMGLKRLKRSKEYQKAMDELTSFVTIGKNEHDDAPDSLTQLAMFVEGRNSIAKVEAIMNPFRMGGNW